MFYKSEIRIKVFNAKAGVIYEKNLTLLRLGIRPTPVGLRQWVPTLPSYLTYSY